MAKNKSKINIGTSGWSYEHWRRRFYPEEVDFAHRLDYYMEFFSTVEINTTFYHLPKETTVRTWAKKTPDDFIFSIKASRYITHIKRFRDAEESTINFFDSIKPLKKKIGPILFQTPPSFKIDLRRIEDFLSALPPKFRYTFEFRHPSWYVAEAYALLHEYGISLCISDLNGRLSPIQETSDFMYIRLHGPEKAYQGSYSDKALKEWAKRMKDWSRQGIDTFCYFDNDQNAYAVKDALKLKEQLESLPD